MLEPFAVGGINPDGSFIHVFNETALNVVMSELDTIQDFTNYLTKKAAFVRSGKLAEAMGEGNLFAYYAIRMNSEDDHDFAVEAGKEPITIDHQHYSRFVSDPRYLSKKLADEISYFWDRLIPTFKEHMLDETSIAPEAQEFDLRKYELGIRQMALVPQFFRRQYFLAVSGALEQGKNIDKFFRIIISSDKAKEKETAFFILIFKYLEWIEKKGEYERYRKMRSMFSVTYANGLLEPYTYPKRVVGITLEPSGQG